MLDGVHSGVKPEQASHVQKCNVAHSESQTPQRGRTRSGAFPLAPGAHCTPFSLSPPNLQYEQKGVPARRHTRRHLAPSSMGPGRTSTQKRVTFGAELA